MYRIANDMEHDSEPCAPEPAFHGLHPGPWSRLDALVDPDTSPWGIETERVDRGRSPRTRSCPVSFLCLGRRRSREMRPGTVGCTTARRCSWLLPLGPQSHLRQRPPGRARRGLAVPLAPTTRVCCRDGDLVPPICHRL